MIDAEGLFRDSLGDNYDEAKATISYNTAISAIKAYVNKDIDVAALYPFQLIQLAVYYYKGYSDINISSKSQGSRSVSILHEIPSEIRSALPRYIRFI